MGLLGVGFWNPPLRSNEERESGFAITARNANLASLQLAQFARDELMALVSRKLMWMVKYNLRVLGHCHRTACMSLDWPARTVEIVY